VNAWQAGPPWRPGFNNPSDAQSELQSADSTDGDSSSQRAGSQPGQN
jgi:hypothetical protein